MKAPSLIVFTDLDGTLLDHHDYSWAPALPALSRLRAMQVPVILASSKTAAEIAPLRSEMRLSACPAIVENGAGILPPHADADQTGDSYARLRATLDKVPQALRAGFRGFGDLSDDDVARITGLPGPQAILARKRAFSEPGLFDSSREDLDAFVSCLSDLGVTARRGGRFLTLSFGGTKADRMDEIAAPYGNPTSIALGDAPNDVEMLEHADHGVIITNPDGNDLPRLAGERDGRIRRSENTGPTGWNEMILRLVSTLTSQD
ncbi:HAD-IIB family hydrolase [Pseudooceanicola sp. C21-150M6]|uniref:HAD-IIB family hydrolase n=1 Tax=Pseudooceanicola sp. C21-150M6 TaxID=3434355 RepID=UPI003D7F5542